MQKTDQTMILSLSLGDWAWMQLILLSLMSVLGSSTMTDWSITFWLRGIASKGHASEIRLCWVLLLRWLHPIWLCKGIQASWKMTGFLLARFWFLSANLALLLAPGSSWSSLRCGNWYSSFLSLQFRDLCPPRFSLLLRILRSHVKIVLASMRSRFFRK